MHTVHNPPFYPMVMCERKSFFYQRLIVPLINTRRVSTFTTTWLRERNIMSSFTRNDDVSSFMLC